MSSTTPSPFLKNIGLMLTYKCNISCPHCIVEAGPHRKEEMRIENALDWINQANTFREGHVIGLAFTGGEPFYDLEKLAKVSEFASSLGFIVSVVTNGFWASTKEEGQKILEKFPAIKMISFSTDIYHKRSIPTEFVKNGVWAAKKLGRFYNIAVCTDNEENFEFKETMNDLKKSGEEENIRVAITFPAGRAQKFASHLSYKTEAKPTPGACTMANSPVIFPDGRIFACIGPLLTLLSDNPLMLGNLNEESLGKILDNAEKNPFLQTIRVWGPERLASLLEENGFGNLLPEEYINECICDCCFKMLSNKTIVDRLNQIFQSREMMKIISYARVYYFNEVEMVKQLGFE